MKESTMILRKGLKGLFFLLVLALSLVPVFQAAHALTHFAPVDTVLNAESDTSQNWSAPLQEAESDTHPAGGLDSDRICLDCLALAAFGILFPVLAFCFFSQIGRQHLADTTRALIFSSFSFPYFTRAPPRA